MAEVVDKSKPLAKVKVVELGTHVVVPNATRIMADYGAEVIKVEPVGGEEWRRLGQVYRLPITKEENAIFTNQNSNKKFLSVNMKDPEGMAIFHKLLAEADIFITNVRAQALEKMRIDYNTLKEKYPRLVYCHFTGLGDKGPDKDRPGFDMAAFWARSGVMVDWVNKGDFPIKPPSGVGDACAGGMLLSGVLMALIGRDATGQGTLITTSLFGSAIWFNAAGVTITQPPYDSYNIYPKSRFAPPTPLSHIYECKDGEWLLITVIVYDTSREKLFKLLDMDEYMDDPRFKTIIKLKEDDNVVTLVKILNEKFKQKTSAEWGEIFTKNNVVYERLRHYHEVCEDPQALANGYLQDVTFPSGTTLKLPTTPIQFSSYEALPLVPTPGIGANTREILAGLGYTKEQTDAMLKNGVVEVEG